MRGAGRAIRGSVRRIQAVRSPPDAGAETRWFKSCCKSVAQAKHSLQGAQRRILGRKGRPLYVHGMRGQPIPVSVQWPGRLAFPDVMFTSGPTCTAKRVLPPMAAPTHAAPVRAKTSPPFPVTGTAEAVPMTTSMADSRTKPVAATLGTRETGPCGCSPSLRQFPAERGTNVD